MIRAGCEARYWSGGHQQQILRCENLVHARLKVCMALAQYRNLHRRNSRAPLQPFAKRRFKDAKVAGMNARRLPRLNGRINLKSVVPPLCVDGGRAQPKQLQIENCGEQAGDNLRLAIVENAFVRYGKTREGPSWSRIRWFEEAS